MSRFTLTRRGGIGTVERIVRIAAGFALTISAAAAFHDSTGIAFWVSLGVALLGIGLVATGADGYCPMDSRLGFGRPRVRGALR
jgi:hypothetical protein